MEFKATLKARSVIAAILGGINIFVGGAIAGMVTCSGKTDYRLIIASLFCVIGLMVSIQGLRKPKVRIDIFTDPDELKQIAGKISPPTPSPKPAQ